MRFGAHAAGPFVCPDPWVERLPTQPLGRRKAAQRGAESGGAAHAATARAHPSVFVGAVAYVPVALVAGYASWNYWVAILLVIALSYGLCSRRVVVGLDFMAIHKFGPYRLAPADRARA